MPETRVLSLEEHLYRLDTERALMLAGISHDLRTPLARLRLEVEMSVQDEEAKRNIALDIAQLDAVIDKFLEYARPAPSQLYPVHVVALIAQETQALRHYDHVLINSQVDENLWVMADETELSRVFQNLFENAIRYGATPNTGRVEINLTSQIHAQTVILHLRDHGVGVEPDKLKKITTPFFRGEVARTAATGAGLGLTIVEKSMQRMGGELQIENSEDLGLLVKLKLQMGIAAITEKKPDKSL
jgi:two-component system, OmpR family, osmolarity sensor histidine kinase EnvZ